MARTVRDTNLGSREARRKLKSRDTPYYRSIDAGLSLGYRRHVGGYGVWLARHRTTDGKYEFTRIGNADDVADADDLTVFSFAQAQRRARERRTKAARPAAYTVRVCIAEYLNYLETEKRTAADARLRANQLILPKLGDIDCAALTSDTLTKWRDELGCSRARNGTAGDADEVARKRRNSANRVLTTLKAALNRAWREGKIPSDDAWRRVGPFKGAGAARVRFLTVEECRRLINAAEGEFRDLVQAGLTTGCRYGELTRLAVSDFNPDSGTLLTRTSKSGKSRHVLLNDEGVSLFARFAAGRAGHELILRRSDGRRWAPSDQARPMCAACKRANIVPAVSFHILRHTWASLAVMDGAPLVVVARGLGHANTKMVEQHYGHLAADYLARQIRQHTPKFGFGDDSNIERLRR